MKILALSNLYPPDFLGGYEIGCAQMVDALRSRGHDVLVAAGAPRHPVATPDHVRRVFRLIDEWNTNSMGDSWPLQERYSIASRVVNAHNIHVLTHLLDEFAPDVVFVSNLLGLGGLGLIACLNYLDVPWVWHLGDCIPRLLCSKFGEFDRVIPTLAEEFSRQFRGHYIPVSQQLRDQIESSGVLLTGDVEVIPYWIEGKRPLANAPRARRDPGTMLRIMSAGQVNRTKGTDLVIEAVGQLRDAGFDRVRLDIYGQVDDAYFGYLISSLDLAGQVRMMGIRPHRELLALYGQYDVFAFPTREREPFGLVPLEAAARGCVPVITRRCGVAEWLVHGVHCLKAARTSSAFAAVFRSILEGEIALEPIARRAEAAAWRDFHIDAILPRIERKLDDAARRPRGRAGTADEAYRMARMGEQLARVLLQEDAVPA